MLSIQTHAHAHTHMMPSRPHASSSLQAHHHSQCHIAHHHHHITITIIPHHSMPPPPLDRQRHIPPVSFSFPLASQPFSLLLKRKQGKKVKLFSHHHCFGKQATPSLICSPFCWAIFFLPMERLLSSLSPKICTLHFAATCVR